MLISGRCVGGSTTINTKVALRATQRELDKWHAATGLCNDRGEPISCADLDPYYDRVERYLGVRDRATDWDLKRCVQTAKRGFEAVGATLEPVRAYIDENCEQCGSCLQGCPTNAGKSTMNTYIQRNVLTGALALRPNSFVERVLIEDRGDGLEATGVEYIDGFGRAADASRPTSSCVAAGSLRTPQVLMRSDVPNPNIGRHLGLHPAQFVFGLFDEPQDAHMVAPITGHCYDFAADEDGGFAVEAVTVQDPIGFTAGLCDENGPMWGQPLVDAAKQVPPVDRAAEHVQRRQQRERRGSTRTATSCSSRTSSRVELERIKSGPGVLDARARGGRRDPDPVVGPRHHAHAGELPDGRRSRRPRWSTPTASRTRSSACTSATARCTPRTLSVNPSLTIMALATRLADYLRLGRRRAARGRPRAARRVTASR